MTFRLGYDSATIDCWELLRVRAITFVAPTKSASAKYPHVRQQNFSPRRLSLDTDLQMGHCLEVLRGSTAWQETRHLPYLRNISFAHATMSTTVEPCG